MKALTIRQPWASLVALGAKHIKTRTRPAPKAMIGQHFAVHAGVALGGRHLDQFGEWTLHVPPYVEDGQHHQLRRLGAIERDNRTLNMEHVRVLPLGAIVATARLVACLPMVDSGDEGAIRTLDIDPNGSLWIVEAKADDDDDQEQREITDQLPYGDFTPGRWAWLFDDVKLTTERCPACMVRADWVMQGVTAEQAATCEHCHGAGTCPPIPAKGQLGFWKWQP